MVTSYSGLDILLSYDAILILNAAIWAVYVTRVSGQVHMCFWQGNLREGDNLEDLGLDGRIKFNGS
jgi:hypothetical protein